MSKLHDRILALAARPGGMRSTDLEDLDASYVLQRAGELFRAGRLFKAKLAHKRVLFFTDRAEAEKAQNKADAQAAAKTQELAAMGRVAKWAPDAKEVYTKKTKFTACPSPKPRFAAIDTPHVYGGNQRGRVVSR